MAQSRVVKTVHQYNALPIPKADMEKLQEIAEDYCKVKNYVYERYGGIGSLSKLYPGYTVQNEMTADGLRTRLGLPSVYYHRAVFEALGDMKGQWTGVKNRVRESADRSTGLTDEDKHYLRFLLKVGNAFEAVLNKKTVELPEPMQKQYDELAAHADKRRVQNYLCRQVRKYHVKLHADTAGGFGITERAYRYGEHGIYLTTKQSRKRIFVPLTDNNQYKNQLHIKLIPERNGMEIAACIHVRVKAHPDYTNQVGVAVGMYTMLTTHEGHCYGIDFGRYHMQYADWLRRQNTEYRKNKADNAGRKKYDAQKHRIEERLHSYINQQINLFLKVEKPQTIYMIKFPTSHAAGVSRKINYSVTVWQRGYVRKRLMQKCREQSIAFVEVIGKGIGKECSICGAEGSSENGVFRCKACGSQRDDKMNVAANTLRRGTEGRILR